MLLNLAEPVVAALVARLAADLPATIATINADGGTEIALPAVIYDCIPSKARLDGGGYPALGIQTVASELTDAVFTGRTELAVLIFLAEAEEDTLTRQVRRYARAVASTVLGNDFALPPAAYGVNLGRINYGPTLDTREDPRPWATWARVPLTCLADER